ncbi:11862_t:CDS:2, partial [Racocetra persica]
VNPNSEITSERENSKLFNMDCAAIILKTLGTEVLMLYLLVIQAISKFFVLSICFRLKRIPIAEGFSNFSVDSSSKRMTHQCNHLKPKILMWAQNPRKPQFTTCGK